jgi:hypothetical protein
MTFAISKACRISMNTNIIIRRFHCQSSKDLGLQEKSNLSHSETEQLTSNLAQDEFKKEQKIATFAFKNLSSYVGNTVPSLDEVLKPGYLEKAWKLLSEDDKERYVHIWAKK